MPGILKTGSAGDAPASQKTDSRAGGPAEKQRSQEAHGPEVKSGEKQQTGFKPTISPLAGKPAPKEMLVDTKRLELEYFERLPNHDDPGQMVSFGTSGHRGSSLRSSFTEAHILAITQAICDYRRSQGIDGPLFMGKDTHALSPPAELTALEVLAANQVETFIQHDNGVTPTPVISRAILVYNRGRKQHLADGILVTPSHNPPEDGGFKYNPPSGGPADTHVTSWIQDRANVILAEGLRAVRRCPFSRALAGARRHDFISEYVNDLASVVDMEAIRSARLSLCADPLGGAGVVYWGRIAERYGLSLTIQHDVIDPTFRFMRVDWDGKIRMDCSSPYAMAGLIALKDKFDVAFACDTDHDRHGVVTRSAGLLNPNHYLGAAILQIFAFEVDALAALRVECCRSEHRRTTCKRPDALGGRTNVIRVNHHWTQG